MKFKRIDLSGGSDEFPTGTTLELRVQRAQLIVKKVAEALIGMDVGWTLDAPRNATTTDFASVPPREGAENMPGLFLRNSVSGCKLFVCYFASASRYGISEFGGGHFFINYNTASYGQCGLIMSMIPGTSEQEFGVQFDSSFMPAMATPLVSTLCPSLITTYYNRQQTTGGVPSSGTSYTFGVFADSYTVAISVCQGGSVPSVGVPTYAVGRIVGTLAHSEDSADNSRYCVLLFRDTKEQSSNDACVEGTRTIPSYAISNLQLGDGNSKKIVGLPIDANSLDYTYARVFACISRADGEWINGGLGSYHAAFTPADLIQFSGRIYSSVNGSSRWTPMSIFCATTDLSTNGVVEGDGFKGYADTDMFRYANGERGQLYDNGNFINLGYNLLIGWEADNDSLG